LIYPIWRSTKAYTKIVSKISGAGNYPVCPFLVAALTRPTFYS